MAAVMFVLANLLFPASARSVLVPRGTPEAATASRLRDCRIGNDGAVRQSPPFSASRTTSQEQDGAPVPLPYAPGSAVYPPGSPISSSRPLLNNYNVMLMFSRFSFSVRPVLSRQLSSKIIGEEPDHTTALPLRTHRADHKLPMTPPQPSLFRDHDSSSRNLLASYEALRPVGASSRGSSLAVVRQLAPQPPNVLQRSAPSKTTLVARMETATPVLSSSPTPVLSSPSQDDGRTIVSVGLSGAGSPATPLRPVPRTFPFGGGSEATEQDHRSVVIPPPQVQVALGGRWSGGPRKSFHQQLALGGRWSGRWSGGPHKSFHEQLRKEPHHAGELSARGRMVPSSYGARRVGGPPAFFRKRETPRMDEADEGRAGALSLGTRGEHEHAFLSGEYHAATSDSALPGSLTSSSRLINPPFCPGGEKEVSRGPREEHEASAAQEQHHYVVEINMSSGVWERNLSSRVWVTEPVVTRPSYMFPI